MLFLLLMAGLPLVACRGEPGTGDPGLRLELDVSPTPPAVGPADLFITLQDTAGTALSGARVTVEGNMSHAGMVPVRDTATFTEADRYVVKDFDFTMAGDWVLTVEATLPDGREARLEHSTTVVAPPTTLSPDTGTDPTKPGEPGATPVAPDTTVSDR